MPFSIYASFFGGLLGFTMAVLSVFLVLLILVQRGRGGGLTGALGGPGGQSAFGSKAGDTFTRITFIVAGIWIFLCAFTMFSLGNARTIAPPPLTPAQTLNPGPGSTTSPEAPPSDGLGGIQIPSAPQENPPATAPETPSTPNEN